MMKSLAHFENGMELTLIEGFKKSIRIDTEIYAGGLLIFFKENFFQKSQLKDSN